MCKEITDEKLFEMAVSARGNSYCPYSGFAVGAALLSEDGRIFTGCNIENAAFGPGICAERTAFFKAVSEGVRGFLKIAVAGGRAGEEIADYTAPCGVCRQVMMEFCPPKEFEIILGNKEGKIRTYLLEELLPMGFGPGNLTEK